MRSILTTLGVVVLLALGGVALLPDDVSAQTSLPPCASDGDKDGDGVADWVDSDETDSCTASFTGVEDCSTGAGDGLPDCQ